MAGYRPTQIRKPSDETAFETNCVVLFKDLLSDPNVKRVGTRGQFQPGVDIIGKRNRDSKQIVGIQCKLKSGVSKLTKKEVNDEVAKALTFKPRLKEYFIVTTSKDDTKLQQLALVLTQDQQAKGRKIDIEIWGWDTLQERINQSQAAKDAFDPGFSPTIASQNRKIDAVLAGQSATQDQVAALNDTIQKTASDTSTRLPLPFADRELREGLSRILRRRGFAQTDIGAELSVFANRAIDGDLSSGSNSIRSEVCDRAARANISVDARDIVLRFRSKAAELDPTRDLYIIDALLSEAEGNPDVTLRKLRERVDPETRSALFTSLIRQRGRGEAVCWIRSEDLAPADLNPPGTMNLVIAQIENGEFEEALRDISRTPAAYFDQCPALCLLRARLTLASILPADQKGALFHGLPIDPKTLQLAAGSDRHRKIELAQRDLQRLLGLLDRLDLGFLESFLSELKLWLLLEDATTRAAAREQLASEITDPEKTLHRVGLALAYGIPFNQDALERYLASQKELGGWTPDERHAAFLIAYHSRDLKRVAEFFDKYHDDLFAQSDLARNALAGIEIEVLARTGRLEDARRHIALHRGADLTAEQASDIEEFVSHIEKGDEVENLRQRYEKSQNLTDLRLLVTGLRARRDVRRLASYAPILARATKSPEDFGVAIKSLFETKRDSELLTFIDELPELQALDDEYASIKGWTLFHLGRVMEARAVARDLLTRRDVTNDRELAINTAIETGDWGNLQAILAHEASRTATIPATDLVRLARLALEASSPYVDHFRDAALRKAPDDPEINLVAYTLAIDRGAEYQGSQAHGWLQKAIEKSGSDGPVRSVSTRELVAQAPEWNKHAENISQSLRRGEVPVFIAAKAIRRQVMDVTLGQALRNTDRDDTRLKYPVFAFSGAQSVRDATGAKSVALDITSLITLDYLGLLEIRWRPLMASSSHPRPSVCCFWSVNSSSSTNRPKWRKRNAFKR